MSQARKTDMAQMSILEGCPFDPAFEYDSLVPICAVPLLCILKSGRKNIFVQQKVSKFFVVLLLKHK